MELSVIVIERQFLLALNVSLYFIQELQIILIAEMYVQFLHIFFSIRGTFKRIQNI